MGLQITERAVAIQWIFDINSISFTSQTINASVTDINFECLTQLSHLLLLPISLFITFWCPLLHSALCLFFLLYLSSSPPWFLPLLFLTSVSFLLLSLGSSPSPQGCGYGHLWPCLCIKVRYNPSLPCEVNSNQMCMDVKRAGDGWWHYCHLISNERELLFSQAITAATQKKTNKCFKV